MKTKRDIKNPGKNDSPHKNLDYDWKKNYRKILIFRGGLEAIQDLRNVRHGFLMDFISLDRG